MTSYCLFTVTKLKNLTLKLWLDDVLTIVTNIHMTNQNYQLISLVKSSFILKFYYKTLLLVS